MMTDFFSMFLRKIASISMIDKFYSLIIGIYLLVIIVRVHHTNDHNHSNYNENHICKTNRKNVRILVTMAMILFALSIYSFLFFKFIFSN